MTAPPEVSDEIRKVYADHVAEINKREVAADNYLERSRIDSSVLLPLMSRCLM